MTDAIQGTYADFKLVKTRSVIQFIVEIPIERVDEVYKLFGMPNFGAEQWVAIAPLKTEAKVDTSRKDAYQEKLPGAQAVARSAILCGEPAFQDWLVDQDGGVRPEGVDPEYYAAELLRLHCEVGSRAEIATNEEALTAYLDVEHRYRDHQRYGPIPEEQHLQGDSQ